jgi:hypothetical protein
VDHVEWVVGLGLPEVVHEQYARVVLGGYGEERVDRVAVLVVLRTLPLARGLKRASVSITTNLQCRVLAEEVV